MKLERLTDEQIRELDVVPEVLPHLFLGRSGHVDEVAADLDVRAVDDRQLGADFLDQRDQPGHLGIVYSIYRLVGYENSGA